MSRTFPTGTLLGFDFGTRRIGVAVGQTLTSTANPLLILTARDGKPDWTHVSELIDEWRPVALVVGVPTHADGTDNDISPRARRFARRLQGRYGRPVYTLDERLSSRAAAEALQGRRPDQPLDDMAAARILQDWLSDPTSGRRLDTGTATDNEDETTPNNQQGTP